MSFFPDENDVIIRALGQVEYWGVKEQVTLALSWTGEGRSGTLHPHLWAAALVNLKFPSFCSLTTAQQPLEGAVSSQFWLSLPPTASLLLVLKLKRTCKARGRDLGGLWLQPSPLRPYGASET